MSRLLFLLTLPLVCLSCHPAQKDATAIKKPFTVPTRKGNEPIIKFAPPGITFEREITERPGPETVAKFKPALEQDHSISKAYLIWARYANSPDHNPVLAIIGDRAKKQEILEVISRISKTQFGDGFYVDVVFLDPDEERQVRLVAKPFLDRTP